jgi:hypothetical protein
VNEVQVNPVTGLTLRIGTYSHENDFSISSFGEERLRRLSRILDSHPSNEIISRGVAYDEKDNGSDFEERLLSILMELTTTLTNSKLLAL